MTKLGQHFLKSKSALNYVISAADLKETDLVVEIGPGKGVLTKEILKTSKVIAVEKDTDLVEILNEKFESEIENKRLILIEGDIRDLPHLSEVENKKYKIVSNLPYYLTGSILSLILSGDHPPTSMTLILQKEVAARITKKVKGKESILSLSIQLFGKPKYIKTLPRKMFTPPPKVDSAVITITDIQKVDKKEQELFFNLVHIAFAQKRKTVLKKFDKDVQDRLKTKDVDEKTRAEDIPFEIWLWLTKSQS